jgi:guanosine-3',5'-bis(diphosphate) 3'-pyrophosphohydrolase
MLDIVLKFAKNAHGDQKRKYSGEDYIVHPIAVMELLKEYTQDERLLAAALLHDVLEDTPIKKEEMQTFLKGIMDKKDADYTFQLVLDLTDEFTKANYPKLNRVKRKAKETQRLIHTLPEAQTIKYADVIDNAPDIAENDPDFARVFLRESKALLEKMNKGDVRLYQRAVKTVEDCLGKLYHMGKGNVNH